MNFKPAIRPSNGHPAVGLCFIFDQGKLFIKNSGDRISIPDVHDISGSGISVTDELNIGSLDGRPCYAAAVGSGAQPAQGFEFKPLRSLFSQLQEDLIWVAGRANQLVYWQQTHRYCGTCGHPSEDKIDEGAKVCPRCGLVNYPRLSPAVIVAVVNGDKILLARNKRFQIPMFSVLAGFVEPSETLEQCLQREVREEVGVEVKNIRYFGSQPWPFPNSLMIAFTADYAGGEIAVDNTEIMEAAWFSRDKMPRVPPKLSIAGQLIDWFVHERN